jgi:hypothetical protein
MDDFGTHLPIPLDPPPDDLGVRDHVIGRSCCPPIPGPKKGRYQAERTCRDVRLVSQVFIPLVEPSWRIMNVQNLCTRGSRTMCPSGCATKRDISGGVDAGKRGRIERQAQAMVLAQYCAVLEHRSANIEVRKGWKGAVWVIDRRDYFRGG